MDEYLTRPEAPLRPRLTELRSTLTLQPVATEQSRIAFERGG